MTLFEIISNIEEESEKNMILVLTEFLTESQEKEMAFEGKSESSKIFVTGRHDIDIGKDIVIETAFLSKEPFGYEKTQAKVLNFSIREGEYFELLPQRQSAGVLIEFLGQKPNVLSKLHEFKGAYNEEADIVLLTSQAIMDRILQELEG